MRKRKTSDTKETLKRATHKLNLLHGFPVPHGREYYRVLQIATEYYRVLQSATEYYTVLQSTTKYYRVLQSTTDCYRVLQSTTNCYRVPQSTTNCYRVLQSTTDCYRMLQSTTYCYRVLQSTTNCYRVLQSTTEWHRVLHNKAFSDKTGNVRKSYIKARSRNHCCRRKALLHILSVCVCSLSYPACKAHAPYYIIICGLSDYTTFFPRFLKKGTIFGARGKLLSKACNFIFSITFVQNISHSNNIIINARLHIKCPFFLTDFNAIRVLTTDFRKAPRY
jgi:hypothetical protein